MNNLFYVTYTGVQVYPNNLTTLDICLEDIAHHLTKIQRFGGALPLNKSYSVAQHSILMAITALERYGEETARACLLHDASEAYLGDVVSPLKAALPDYQEIEDEVQNLIYTKYNIFSITGANVKRLDTAILLDEAREFVPLQYDLFCNIYSNTVPLGIKIDGNLNPHKVKEKFLSMCHELNIRD